MSSNNKSNPENNPFKQLVQPKKGSLLKISEFFKKIDTFGSTLNFSWNKSAEFKTCLGSCFSIMFFIIVAFVSYVYFFSFIICTDPIVYSTQEYNNTNVDNPMNLHDTLIPRFRFIWYNNDGDVITMVPLNYTEIQCHFSVYSSTQEQSIYESDIFKRNVPYKDKCNIASQYKDEHLDEFNNSHNNDFLCHDTQDMLIYGDPIACEDQCRFYIFSVYQNIDRSGCNLQINNLKSVHFDFVVYNSVVNPVNYIHPWNYVVDYYGFYMDPNLTKIFSAHFQKNQLTTSSHKFGFLDSEDKIEFRTKMSWFATDFQIKDSANTNLYQYEPLLQIFMLPDMKDLSVTRTYPTLIDTLGDIGGVTDIAQMFIAMLIGWRVEKNMEDDIIKTALLISGKYGIIDEEKNPFIKNIYPEIYYEKPKKNCFQVIANFCKKCFCCYKKKTNKNTEKEVENNSGDGEINDYKKSFELNDQASQRHLLDAAFESMLERHLDLNYFFQMCQDFELVKKILFKERHLVLAPQITVEVEKFSVFHKESVENEIVKNESVKNEREKQINDSNSKNEISNFKHNKSIVEDLGMSIKKTHKKSSSRKTQITKSIIEKINLVSQLEKNDKDSIMKALKSPIPELATKLDNIEELSTQKKSSDKDSKLSDRKIPKDFLTNKNALSLVKKSQFKLKKKIENNHQTIKRPNDFDVSASSNVVEENLKNTKLNLDFESSNTKSRKSNLNNDNPKFVFEKQIQDNESINWLKNELEIEKNKRILLEKKFEKFEEFILKQNTEKSINTKETLYQHQPIYKTDENSLLNNRIDQLEQMLRQIQSDISNYSNKKMKNFEKIILGLLENITLIEDDFNKKIDNIFIILEKNDIPVCEEEMHQTNTLLSVLYGDKNGEEDYTRGSYNLFERKQFPVGEKLNKQVGRSQFDLVVKPNCHKNLFEKKMDNQFMRYLPKKFIKTTLEDMQATLKGHSTYHLNNDDNISEDNLKLENNTNTNNLNNVLFPLNKPEFNNQDDSILHNLKEKNSSPFDKKEFDKNEWNIEVNKDNSKKFISNTKNPDSFSELDMFEAPD